ncbi:GTP-binding protein [Kribbella jiaozuonensis]|uniref:GTP-binding protein n=1 Tax=Kribbella jiaozuonensis TaxID=2575441 RepID=UPI0014856E36|nr:ATP/GTP-binding protein [Kribbella jiaozuonensis]
MRDPDVEFKVVVTGPFGVGKTTFIQHISGVPVVGTEEATTGDEAELKPTTTVGLEHGHFDVHGDQLSTRLLLYGTPGQDRFRFMWDVVAEGADACVVLVDVANPSTWPDAARILSFFHDKPITALAVGANRGVEIPVAVDMLREFLATDVTVVPCNVIDERSARHLLVSLLTSLARSESRSCA